MHLRSLCLAAVVFTPVVTASPAQQPDDRAAIKAIVSEEQEAWNRGDAKGFCAHFAPDGSFTNVIGMQTYGYAPFLKQHERIFSTIYKGSHNELSIGTLRFIRPDVAIADVDSVLSKTNAVPPGLATFPDGALHTKLQLVLARQDGQWIIQAFHNVAINPAVLNGPPK